MANPATGADKVAQDVFDTVKLARLVKQTYGRSSLTRSAKDTVAQFPVIFSGDIPTDDAVILAKALEAQYASLLVSVISAHSDYDRSKYDNPADYLRSFHNNRSIPTLFMSMDSQLPDGESVLTCTLESAHTMYDLEKIVSSDLVMECWDTAEDRYNCSSLNSMYHPEKATQDAMESVVKNLRALHKPAMEGGMDGIAGAFGVSGSRTDKDMIGSPTKAEKTTTTIRSNIPQRDENGNFIKDDKGRVVTGELKNVDNIVRSPAATGVQKIDKNDRLTALEPTLVNLQLNSHHGNAPVITHNVVLGVKAMIRSIPQQFMISNLAEGVNNSRSIFKWIKWTEGEYGIVKDLILGISDSKEAAVSNRDMRTWLSALKRRKLGNLIGKLASGEGMPPLTTIVTTSYEVAKIAEMTGMDLNEPYTAVKLMSKYYLLGFMIYDPESGRVKAIFDGDTNYNVVTINGLKSKQQKDQDLAQFSAFMRAAGRM